MQSHFFFKLKQISIHKRNEKKIFFSSFLLSNFLLNIILRVIPESLQFLMYISLVLQFNFVIKYFCYDT